MRYSLIDDAAAAIPVVALTKDQLPAWLAAAPERERSWLTATGFGAEQGKLALVPAEDGRLTRLMVGLADGTDAGTGMWALAGLPEALPEGSYRVGTAPDGTDPTHLALGWALGTYTFTRYRAKKGTATALVWPEGADRGRVERLASAIFLVRDLANTPAGDLGPAELAAEAVRVAKAAGARCRVIVGDELLAENYPTIHAVGRAAAQMPRLVDIAVKREHPIDVAVGVSKRIRLSAAHLQPHCRAGPRRARACDQQPQSCGRKGAGDRLRAPHQNLTRAFR